MALEYGRTADELIDRMRRIVGDAGCVSEPGALEPYLVEWRGLYRGATPVVVRPASTGEVAAVVGACAERRIGIVPQGGNTGLCGGAVPSPDGGEIVVSLERMARIRAVDADNFTMTVDAGCVLADVQRAAEEAGRLFPLSLAAEGSCTIGGNVATNAGGVNVLRYGTMRDLVLGLEVVLPDGRVWNGLKRLRKDTSGYDLKQLFIGAEGTLGVVTGIVLKLYPQPRSIATAWLALRDLDACVELLGVARATTGDALTACELVPRNGLELVLAHVPGARDPLGEPADWYALVELADPADAQAADLALERLVEAALAARIVTDGAIAANRGQRADFWRLRDSMSEAQKKVGGSIKHDVAVPVSELPEFVRAAARAVESRLRGIRIVAFGHAGDGNLHFNLSAPPGHPGPFLERWNEFNEIVHDVARGFGGTIAAEHGIGRLKRAELARCAAPVELELMRALKRTLDPNGLMNPGKVL